jgi:hypothetical protein
MKRFLFAVALLVAGLGAPSAHAYPWMIRHGLAKCGSCHVDPMGGETLNGMGRVMGETLLAMPWGDGAPTAAGKFAFGVDEPEGLHLGGSVRVLSLVNMETGNTRAFPMQTDVYGAGSVGRLTIAASLGVSRASSRREHGSNARLLGDAESEDLILVSRNHWLGYHLDDAWMLRLGRINLPFGIRSPEHTAWVRSETRTDRESDQQHGLSVVYSAGPLRGELMASLGNFQRPDDSIRERGYSGYVEWLLEPDLALGLSSLWLVARRGLDLDEGPVARHAHGVTARVVPWQPLVILAEADVVKQTGSGPGYVGSANFDYEPTQGFHLALTGELLDRGKPSSGRSGLGRGQPHLGAWFTTNWFFAPHFDLRVDFVARQNRGAMLQTQLHLYL